MVNSTEEMASITDLFPGINYSFTVIAINDRGPSSPSAPLAVRTSDEGKRTASHPIGGVLVVQRSFPLKLIGEGGVGIGNSTFKRVAGRP